jgi:hypothetical protein
MPSWSRVADAAEDRGKLTRQVAGTTRRKPKRA